MSAGKIVWVIALVAIAAGVFALYEANTAQIATEALAAVTQERDSLRAQLAKQPKPTTTPAPVTVAPKPLLRPPRAGNAVSTTTATTTTTAVVASRNDPAWLAHYHQRYDAFARQRGLTPEQAERLMEILADWNDASRDFQASIREQGLTATPEAQAQRNRLQRQIEEEPLAALLGDEGRRAYFEYETTSFYRGLVDAYTRSLTAQNLSLTEDQSNQLASLLKPNLQTLKRDPTAMGSEVVINWPPVLKAAAAFLDPAQVAALRDRAARENPRQ
jgi:hypothetical protein